MSDLETEILGRMRSKIFRSHLDVLVLMLLRNGARSCRDIVRFVDTKFRVQVTVGMVYSVLYSFERDDLVKSELRRQKKFFELTDKGQSISKTILDSYPEISNYSANLFHTLLKEETGEKFARYIKKEKFGPPILIPIRDAKCAGGRRNSRITGELEKV